MELAKIIILAIAIFALNRGGFYFLSLATQGKSTNRSIIRYFPVAELILWVFWAWWAINLLTAGTAIFQVIVTLLLVAMVALAGWYFGRDWIAGVVFKANHVPRCGNQINTTMGSGIIVKISVLTLEIITKTGEHIAIPYSSLAGKAIVNSQDKGQGKEFTFTATIKKNYDIRILEKEIKKIVLQLPWTIPAADVAITVVSYDPENTIEIRFSCVDDRLFAKTGEILQNYIDRLNQTASNQLTIS